MDTQYTNLVADVQGGVVQKYWLEDILLYAKGTRLFVSKGGQLRQDILKEHHDFLWAGHLRRESMTALLSQHFYLPNIGNDIEAYMKTCTVCQQDKFKKRQEVGLLQPYLIPE